MWIIYIYRMILYVYFIDIVDLNTYMIIYICTYMCDIIYIYTYVFIYLLN